MRWKYTIANNLSIEALDKYGADGWKLITVLLSGNGHSIYYFKRRIND